MDIEKIINLSTAAVILLSILLMRILDARADRIEHQRKMELLRMSHWINKERFDDTLI
jgi:hypothetical protein